MARVTRNMFVFLLCVQHIGAYTVTQRPSPRIFDRISPQTHKAVEPTFLIFHHTFLPLEQSLDEFTKRVSNVSVHYMIDQAGNVYQHVPEDKLAKHCGDESYWHDLVGINAHSIGIELVNMGFKEKPDQPSGITVPGLATQWYPYPEQQITRAIELARDILQRHPHIVPWRVLAHADIAPCRKNDPGPLFPWKQCAEQGVGVWPHDAAQYTLPCLEKVYDDDTLRHVWFMKHLHYFGYRKPKTAKQAYCIVRSFQMHFRQTLIDGLVDRETADTLKALLCEQAGVNSTCPCCGIGR